MRISVFVAKFFEKVLEVAQKKYFLATSLIFITTVFLNGISLLPGLPFLRIARNPWQTLTDFGPINFWQETVLLPLIAFYTRLTAPLAFLMLCLVIILITFLLFACLSYRKWDPLFALISTTIFIVSPVTTVILSWLGSADGLTLTFTILFLFIRSAPLLLLLTLVGATNHVVVLLAGCGILILRWVARDQISFKQLGATLIGGCLGILAVKGFLATNHIQVISRFDYIFLRDIGLWVQQNLRYLPVTIFTLFNLQWIILIICWVIFFRMDKKYFVIQAGILVSYYFVCLFTEDTTRIFSLLSWGVLMHCLFHCYKLAIKTGRQYLNEFLIILVVIGFLSIWGPRIYSWKGTIVSSPFLEFFLENR